MVEIDLLPRENKRKGNAGSKMRIDLFIVLSAGEGTFSPRRTSYVNYFWSNIICY